MRGIWPRSAGRVAWMTDRVWAIEDCRHVSRRLEQALLAAGERVVRVAPHRMGASRKGEREPGKSDEIDALAVARAVVKDGVEQFPVAYLDERAMEIRLLNDHRKRSRRRAHPHVNRLRWHLLALCPELERSLKRGALNQARVLDRVDRALRSSKQQCGDATPRAWLRRHRSVRGLGAARSLLFSRPLGPRYCNATHSAVLPRAADGCIARMMRKPNGARTPRCCFRRASGCRFATDGIVGSATASRSQCATSKRAAGRTRGDHWPAARIRLTRSRARRREGAARRRRLRWLFERARSQA